MRSLLLLLSNDVGTIVTRPVCQEIFCSAARGNGEAAILEYMVNQGKGFGFTSCYLCLIATYHTEKY